MGLIKNAIKLGYEKHSGFTSDELDGKLIKSVYKQIEHFLIQKWLMEEHKTYVTIEFDYGYEDNRVVRFLFTLVKNEKEQEPENYLTVYKTFEEALEEGLKQALELIKSAGKQTK